MLIISVEILKIVDEREKGMIQGVLYCHEVVVKQHSKRC